LGLFAKKFVSCPMCQQELAAKENKLSHYATHAIRTDSGDYGWKCPCGEADGYWDSDFGAAAGMAQHFANRHGIYMTVSLGQ
jgi:hypothetical protein